MNTKIQTYPFSIEGLEKLKMDKIKDKFNNATNIIFCTVIFVLLLKGIIGQKFIIEYIVGSCTSKTVKCAIHILHK